MKIVVLDGYTLNPGDLSWERLEMLGDLSVYDRTMPGQIMERIAGSEIVLTNKSIITADHMKSNPSIKMIGVLATGYNVLDLDYATKAGIKVTNVPAYSTKSVAQLVFAMIMTFCHRIEMHDNSVKMGEWVASKDFSYWKSPLHELSGKTMGIIGYGNIGKKVAEIALAFDMNVLIYSRHPKRELETEQLKFADLEDLYRKSDFLSLHIPLNDETKLIINRDNLAKMKANVFLVNTGRGGLIDEKALAEALNSGIIAGAGVDVVSIEPMTEDNPLLKAKNIFITPHIAWATLEARTRLMNCAIDNVEAFILGQPQNVIN